MREKASWGSLCQADYQVIVTARIAITMIFVKDTLTNEGFFQPTNHKEIIYQKMGMQGFL